MNQHISTPQELNGFNLVAFGDIVEQIQSDPSVGMIGFRVHSEWRGAARTEARITGYELGGQRIAREHVVHSDEPVELMGSDTAPNPQELLFAAHNACMIFGYASTAAGMGIRVDRLSIETTGSLDVRGSLGLAPVAPGMETIHYQVRIASNATAAQLRELHELVSARSPNRYHIASPIRLEGKLVAE